MNFFSKLDNGLKFQVSGGHTSDSSSPEVDDALTDDIMLPSYTIQTSLPRHDSREGSDNIPNQSNDSKIQPDDELLGIDKTSIKSSNGPSRNAQWPTAWGHKPVSKYVISFGITNGISVEYFLLICSLLFSVLVCSKFIKYVINASAS